MIMLEKPTRTLDVRPLLKSGTEPFPAIMEAKDQLRPGETLILRAPFEPTPLFPLFKGSGYRVESTRLGEGDWEIRFEPESTSREGSPRELDLRFLPPPAPLQKVLEALGTLGRGEELILHTRFRPVHLFEQLDDGHVDYDCEECAPNHWTTRLWRVAE
jgi:uncharacterized protein (DUF2249 family)